MPLLQHLKILKTAIPIPQKQINIDSKMSIFKKIKKLAANMSNINKDGMFFNESFCFPLLDPENDPKKK